MTATRRAALIALVLALIALGLIDYSLYLVTGLPILGML